MCPDRPKESSPSNIHATTVDFDGFGIVITGRAGSGKSALALELLARGASLVADDFTTVETVEGQLIASAPAAIKGMIEARGIGLLGAAYVSSTHVRLTIDMDTVEPERLPDLRTVDFFGVKVVCLYKVDAPYFSAAIVQYVKGGRKEPS